VRKVGNDIRINAKLIDATTGHHLWGERYDGKLQNIFSLQDEISRKIVSSLAVKLGAHEQKDVKSPETENIEAYDALLKGYEYYFRGTVDDAVMAISYFEKAIELDQNYGRAYAAIAKTYFQGPKIGREWYTKTDLSYRTNMARARHYLEMANKRPTFASHQIASLMALQRRQYKRTLAEAELALSLEPNGVESNFNMGYVLVFLGRAKEGIGYLKRSIELDPLRPGWALFYMGLAHFSMGQFDEAVELINRALTYNPKTLVMSGILAAAYAHLGRDEEALDRLQNYLRGFWFRPDLNAIMSDWPFKDPKVADRLAEGLIKAGLPGQASDYCKVIKENKLPGEEIRELLFGRSRKVGSYGATLVPYSVSCTKDGRTEYMSANYYDTGKSWIEGDSVFFQYDTLFEGRKFSGEVYRNPDGTPEKMNEYFIIFDHGIRPFSVEG
jgi:tetratricopeptide (TPR) repeat protein